MDATQAGLFDLPDPEPAPATERTRSGRNRETWSRTTTADVTIVDSQALREAAALAAESSVSIELEHDPHRAGPPSVGDFEIGGPGPPPGNSAFDCLAGLIWPTDGMEGPSRQAPSGCSRPTSRSRPHPPKGAGSHGRSPSNSPTSPPCADSRPKRTQRTQR